MEGQRSLDRATKRPIGSVRSQPIVSSRRRALERLLAAIDNGPAGPVLITGEPGAGKTWLVRKLVEMLPSRWWSVSVDLAAEMDALEFLRLIGHSFGVTVPDRLGEARFLVRSTLEDEAADGRNWLLVVDEAHRGSGPVWDEIHAIRNQLGLNSGFAGLFVLGQTELARALATRRFTGFATSLQARLHLMPLDLDEARELLSARLPDGSGAEPFLEELHRDAGGNPGKLLRLADSRQLFAVPEPVEGSHRDRSALAPVAVRLPAIRVESPVASVVERRAADGRVASHLEQSRIHTPPLIPTRPPIRLEDGLVEVGWEGDLDLESASADVAGDEPRSLRPGPADTTSNEEELIEDRYAALQAWTEWTANQERLAGENAIAAAAQIEASSLEVEVADGHAASFTSQRSAEDESSVATAAANLRAEPQHDFAPYSQLFTRLRHSR